MKKILQVLNYLIVIIILNCRRRNTVSKNKKSVCVKKKKKKLELQSIRKTFSFYFTLFMFKPFIQVKL